MIFVPVIMRDIGLQFPFLVMSFSGFDIRVMQPSRNELVNNPPLLFSEIYDV